MGAFVFIDH